MTADSPDVAADTDTDTDAGLDVPSFEIGDHISDAYYGSMGEAFARKVRQRVHWIAEQVQGHAVLDIGCSQGIGCVLLGREGHRVEGVDIDAAAIARANEYLAREPQSVRDNVTFRHADFMGADFDDRRFSTIVMGEVLEHLVRPQAFVARAWDLLEEGGRIVVTVPFGINDFPDHKRTFYLAEMTRLLHPAFDLAVPRYFGRWIGFVGTRRDAVIDTPPAPLDMDTVAALERAFHTLERELVDRVVELKGALTTTRASLREAVAARKDAVAAQKDAVSAQKAAVADRAEALRQNEREVAELRAAHARALQAETEALQAETEAHARALRAETEALRAAHDKALQAAMAETGTLRTAEAAGRKTAQAEATRLKETIAALKRENASQAKQIEARIRDIAVLGLRFESTAGEVRALRASTSWRLTRPLRAVVRRLRR